jgi:hypothetical protein
MKDLLIEVNLCIFLEIDELCLEKVLIKTPEQKQVLLI